jgi:major membrane immunogen (membrane-anchored lipoprotein)
LSWAIISADIDEFFFERYCAIPRTANILYTDIDISGVIDMKKKTVVLIVLALAMTVLFTVGCAKESEPAAAAPAAPAASAPEAKSAPEAAPAAPAAPVEKTKSYVDGIYFAMDDEFGSSGWKYAVTITVQGGKIADVDWNGVNVSAGVTKKVYDKAGKYNMVKFGGAQAEWSEQAELAEAYLIETQDPKAITYTDDSGHTDDIAGVSIHVVEMFNLAEKALAKGPVGIGPYMDGAYFAIADEYPSSGWKEYVSLTVLNGRIAAVNWSAVNKKGDDKKPYDKAGKYQMVARGGAQDEWYVQANRAEEYLIEVQDPSDITYSDAEGHTDAISGVSIHVDALFDLADKALAAGPVELGPFADGGYYASEDEFSSSGWKGYVSLLVKDGNIVNVFWSAVDKDGNDKKTYDKEGNYQMVARGGAIDEWYVQAERVENYLLETQDPGTITYKDDNGHTDDIAGATIHVNDFFSLVEKALAAGPKKY